MNKHLFISLALIAAVISGCKKEQAKSDLSSTLDCGQPDYRQAHTKECQDYDKHFTPNQEAVDLMKKLSE